MSPFDDPEVCRAVLDSLSVGVYLVDRQRKILFWNAGAERISGYLRHEVLGRCCRDEILVHSDEKGRVVCATECPLQAAIQEGEHGESHLYLHHRNGHRIPVLVRAVPIRDASGTIIGAAESFDEPRSALAIERREHPTIAPQYLDPVTQLANQTFCQVRLRIFLSAFAVEKLPFSVLLIRIHELERFISKHGAEAGRLLMRAVGETLGNTVRTNDFAGRWSANEFLMILANCDSSRAPLIGGRIASVANAASIHWWGDELSAPVSFGFATCHDEDSLEWLIERARQSLERGWEKAAGTAGS
jgi:diguanylate cyclase (GGDEF)-like protein/PAS domain S-box-containing protein